MPKQKHAHVLLLPGETLRIICARSALDDEDDATLPDVLITNADDRASVDFNPNANVEGAAFSVAFPLDYHSLDGIFVWMPGRNTEYQQLITLLT